MADDPYKYFRLEARELVDELGKGALALEQATTPEVVQRLLRHAHTLKGAARVVRVPHIAEKAHAIEDVLTPFREGTTQVPREQITALLALVDDVAAQVGALEAKPTPPAATARPAPVEEQVVSVRAEVSEIDRLLEGVFETHGRLRRMRDVSTSLDRAGRLADLLLAQVAAHAQTGSHADKTRSVATELRELVHRLARQLDTGVDDVERELSQVRETGEQLRLVPVDTMFTALERTARDAAATLGKQVTFEARGGRVRIDSQVLFAIQGALVQLVRNAVAHGIETPAERARAGKTAAGVVELDVIRRGRRVVFRCRDDGRGLDREAVRRAAQRRGIAVSAELDASELLGLLLRGGVSTAAEVTEVAGRGIGLDLVREVIDRLGGEIAVGAGGGPGTAFEIEVPVSLASVEVLVVEADGVVASLPLDAVRSTRRIADADISRTPREQTIVLADRAIPFVSLASLVRHAPQRVSRRKSHVAVILEGGGDVVAFGVDRLVETAPAVVRALPAIAGADPLVAGSSLDEAGAPRLVLDPDHLVLAARGHVPQMPVAVARKSILVVDDSLTTRMLEQSILESAGYDVDTATSGEEGLEVARRKRYALFLVDVEMPGIDGFTFIERVRADPDLRDTPAILVTSRNAPEDRQRGAAVGAQGYVVKGELDQGDLLANIERMVASR